MEIRCARAYVYTKRMIQSKRRVAHIEAHDLIKRLDLEKWPQTKFEVNLKLRVKFDHKLKFLDKRVLGHSKLEQIFVFSFFSRNQMKYHLNQLVSDKISNFLDFFAQ